MRFLTNRPPCRIVMEACGTAHYWGRVAQRRGHRVTLLPPNDVRPFVRRNKTDRADAEALVDASRVERVPAVPIKRAEHQALVASARDESGGSAALHAEHHVRDVPVPARPDA